MDNNNTDDDLKKAIAFLLEKEMKQYSIEKKKEFLLKKVSPEIVEKALDLYTLIESNMSEQLKNFKKENKKGFLDNFFDFGVISSVLLATLGINYLIDLNRNKKNDLFYKEIEKKINDELKASTDNMNSELKQSLSNYVVKDNLSNEIHSQIQTYAQERGLSLNLSSKSIKENVAKINGDIGVLDKKVKELSVKIDNNNLLFRQDMMKEFNNIIEENNIKLLKQVIDNQNNLMKAMTEMLKGDRHDRHDRVDMPIQRIDIVKTEKIVEKSVIPNEIQIMPSQDESEKDDFSNILKKILNTMVEDNSKDTFLSKLLVLFINLASI
jgi:hypothetical protein